MSKVTLNGEAVKLVGDELSVGDYAPEVELVLADLKTLKVGGSSEKFSYYRNYARDGGLFK